MKTGSELNVGKGCCVDAEDTVFSDLDEQAWFVYREVTHEGRVRQKLSADTYLRIDENGKSKVYTVGDKGKLQTTDLVVAVDVDITWSYDNESE